MYNVHNVDGLCYSVYICGFILCTEHGNKFAKRQRKKNHFALVSNGIAGCVSKWYKEYVFETHIFFIIL